MLKISLGTACNFVNGRAFKPSHWTVDGLPIVRIQNLNDENAPFNYYNGEYKQCHLIDSGTLLFSWSGTPGTSFGAFFWNRGKALLNQHIFKVEPKIDIDLEYLKYVLNGNIKKIISKAHGGVGLQHITKKELEKIDINICDKNKQIEIVNILKVVERTIDYRKRQVICLENLIKSQFIEMFGDTVSNSKGWDIKQLQDIGEWKSGGTPSRTNKEYFKGDIDWYSAGELNQLYLEGSVEKITQEAIQESSTKVFYKGSMLIGMYDTAAFKMGILQRDSASNQACANIMPNDDVDIVWLYYNLMHMKEHFLSNRRGIRQKNLNLGMIKEFEIPIPPIEIQKQFVIFVQQVEKQKFIVQQNLYKLQELFDSLMQQFFL